MAGRSMLDGPTGPDLLAKLVALLENGASYDDAAGEVGMHPRTLARASRRPDATGEALRAAHAEGDRTRKRVKLELEHVERSADLAIELAAARPGPQVRAGVIVPEVLQTPSARVRDGDRDVERDANLVDKTEIIEILSAAARDPEAPAHLIAVAKLSDYHLAGEVEARKIEARFAARESAERRRRLRGGPNKSAARERIDETLRRRQLADADTEQPGEAE